MDGKTQCSQGASSPQININIDIIPIKIPARMCIDTDKIILKLI